MTTHHHASRDLLVLKEDLKKETASSDSSDSRLVDLLEEIGRCCENVTRDAFVESKIGGIVKKITETHKDRKPAQVAHTLVEKWKATFSNKAAAPTTPSGTSASASASSHAHVSHQHHVDHHPAQTHKPPAKEVAKISSPQDPKRKKTCTFLSDAFNSDLHNSPANLIFNVGVEIEEALHQLGQDQYISKSKTLRLNLQKNAPLRHKILSGEVKASELVNFSPEQLLPDSHREVIDKAINDVAEAKRSDWLDANREKFNKQAGVKEQGGMFRCGKCGSTKTTHYQKQTRSADEPMTVFVQCLDCKNRWRTQ